MSEFISYNNYKKYYILNETYESYVELKLLAQDLDINHTQFNTCLDDRRYVNLVRQDYIDGESLKIPGTPTWYINGKRITGTLSENDFRDLINGLKSKINQE